MTDSQPVLYRRFALAVFVGAGAVAVAVITLAWWAVSGFQLIGGGSDLDAARRLAAGLAIPLSVLGSLLVPLGAAMAVVEWRGTFASPTEREVEAAAPDLGKMLVAVGKLKGAALVMVVGALLLGGSAWVASSAAKAPPAPARTVVGGIR